MGAHPTGGRALRGGRVERLGARRRGGCASTRCSRPDARRTSCRDRGRARIAPFGAQPDGQRASRISPGAPEPGAIGSAGMRTALRGRSRAVPAEAHPTGGCAPDPRVRPTRGRAPDRRSRTRPAIAHPTDGRAPDPWAPTRPADAHSAGVASSGSVRDGGVGARRRGALGRTRAARRDATAAACASHRPSRVRTASARPGRSASAGAQNPGDRCRPGRDARRMVLARVPAHAVGSSARVADERSGRADGRRCGGPSHGVGPPSSSWSERPCGARWLAAAVRGVADGAAVDRTVVHLAAADRTALHRAADRTVVHRAVADRTADRAFVRVPADGAVVRRPALRRRRRTRWRSPRAAGPSHRRHRAAVA
ncbi:hypothetical protein EV383_4655 [Pseudonocardia sediminis]|uniref:Uncharacterized protein n=1 Tax=Pseudonocardia sediminis TaxID=1397368 RepID=A0A4Q7V528_PSEST|nr:hypothetical protein EV383_4655 [Pseudonocardia sediminis]